MDYDKDNAKHNIIATGPVVPRGGGMLARRYVLRDLSTPSKVELVTHLQVWMEDGSTCFNHGHYFAWDSANKVARSQVAPAALKEALDDLHERIMGNIDKYFADGEPIRLCG
jgi:hypothetical protein